MYNPCGRVLTNKEKWEIVDYAKAHPNDENFVEFLSSKYNCSHNNIHSVLIAEMIGTLPEREES